MMLGDSSGRILSFEMILFILAVTSITAMPIFNVSQDQQRSLKPNATEITTMPESSTEHDELRNDDEVILKVKCTLECYLKCFQMVMNNFTELRRGLDQHEDKKLTEDRSSLALTENKLLIGYEDSRSVEIDSHESLQDRYALECCYKAFQVAQKKQTIPTPTNKKDPPGANTTKYFYLRWRNWNVIQFHIWAIKVTIF